MTFTIVPYAQDASDGVYERRDDVAIRSEADLAEVISLFWSKHTFGPTMLLVKVNKPAPAAVEGVAS